MSSSRNVIIGLLIFNTLAFVVFYTQIFNKSARSLKVISGPQDQTKIFQKNEKKVYTLNQIKKRKEELIV